VTGVRSADAMVEFSIRCHPSVPLEAADLEDWLEARARDLRAAWPSGTIRLLRLSQPLPSAEVHVGWLLEVELPADEQDVAPWLAETLRDMRLLGFQPALTYAAPDVNARRCRVPAAARLR
jgi:hypothetical protein